MFNPKLSHSLPAGGRNSGTIIAASAVTSAFATAVTSANGRQLPSLFILGAQNCSTTSFTSQLFDQYGASAGYAFNDGDAWSDRKEHVR